VLQVAFAETFPASLEQPVRRHLTTPCEIIVAHETDFLPQLQHIDVLVTMVLSAEMGRAATRLKLVQVPGAGLDRIDRSALPRGAMLANAYGHETGIAEYVIGVIVALTREFTRLDGRCAALDVLYRYPREAGPAAPATRPFHELPNVLMTPHVSGWTDGMLDARAKLIAENIRRVACQEAPLNLVSS
jgi:phosphoglycerate dehydrogenase-like enzyme